jgi:hypothetical protein
VGRGRFLVGLGVGFGLLGLLSKIAQATLFTGSPAGGPVGLTTSLAGFGILLSSGTKQPATA